MLLMDNIEKKTEIKIHEDLGIDLKICKAINLVMNMNMDLDFIMSMLPLRINRI